MRYQLPVGEAAAGPRALLTDPRFATLWLSQGLAQTAQNALLFTLLVVVLDITGSSTHTSLLVLSFILPSIPMGMAVGVLLDRWHKGRVLVATSILRAAACILYLFFHSNVWAIYGISLGFATSGLFFNPAVVSLIPTLVPRERLVSANGLYNFTLTGSQLVGIVFLAPLMIKSAGPSGMFIAGAVLFSTAAALASRLARLHTEDGPKLPQGPLFGAIPREFREGWRALTADPASSLAMAQLIASSTLVLLFAIIIPRYMNDTLGISPDNAAFVFAPTGVGALVGLRFLPWFTRWGKTRTVIIGLFGIAVCLVLLALVKPLAEVTEQTPGPLNPQRFLRISLLQALTMAFAGPLGLFYALLNAPAQTVLHERAPAEMRGRIFATQVVSANFLSLVPLLIIGGVTDLLGITAVLLLIAAAVAALGGLSILFSGKEEEPPSPGPGVEASVDTPRGVG